MQELAKNGLSRKCIIMRINMHKAQKTKPRMLKSKELMIFYYTKYV